MAGLLYDCGAWWVTSVRGDDPAAVIRGLRRMAPRCRRNRLLAVPWSDADEADYRLCVSRGGYMTIRDPGLLRG